MELVKNRAIGCLVAVWLGLACLPASFVKANASDFGPTETFDASSGNTTDTVAHKLNDDGTTITVTGDGTYTYTLDGVISGVGNLIKTSPGTLVLGNADNTFTGGTIVNGGTLRIAEWNSINPNSIHNAVTGSGSKLLGSKVIRVGDSGTGALTITDGGTVTAAIDILLGTGGPSSHGTVTVSGNGSALEAIAESIYVGTSGTGVLTIADGGIATAHWEIYLGTGTNASGMVKVSGNESELKAGTSFYIGAGGTGDLTVINGGKASSGRNIYVGSQANSSGTVTIGGSGSKMESATNLIVGRQGTGVLILTDGGTGTSGAGIILGDSINSSGTVDVSGTNSRMTATESIYVGNYGIGVLNIQDGGTVSAKSFYLGNESNSSGTVTVGGSGSKLEVEGGISVGIIGAGVLTITDGGTVSASSISLGNALNSSGMVTVKGPTTRLETKNDISVGRNSGSGLLAGTGTVIANNDIGEAKNITIFDNGTLSAGDAAGHIGTLTIGETLSPTTLVLSHGGTLRVDSNGTATDLIYVNGDAIVGLTSTQTINVDLGGLNTVTNQTILQARDVLNVRGDLTGTTFKLKGVNITTLDRVTVTTASVTQSGNSLVLNTEFAAQSKKMDWNGGTTGNWDMTSSNWTDGGSTTKFLTGDWAGFAATGATIAIATGGGTASQMDVTGGTWNFTGDLNVNRDSWIGLPIPAGVEGKLSLSGNSSVTLTGNNSFAGGIDIAGGSSLILKSDTSAGAETIRNDGTIIPDFSGTFANSISGAGSLTKLVDGVLTLSGTNTYTGATTVSAGTLSIAGDDNIGTGTNTLAGATLRLTGTSYAKDWTFSGLDNTIETDVATDMGGVLSGSGSLTKLGKGILTLSGDSSTSYNGTFTHSAGGVHLSGKLGGTFVQNAGTTFTAGPGAALRDATFKGSVALTDTLNVATATFDNSTIDLSTGLGSNGIIASGAVAFIGSGNTTLTLGDLSGVAGGDYLLMTGSAITGIDKAVISAILGTDRRGGLFLDDSGMNEKLYFKDIVGNTTLTWNGTASNSSWNTAAANTNWSAGGFSTWFKTNDAVVFGSGAAYKNVTVDAAGVTVDMMMIEDDYNFSGGTITATGDVVVDADKSLGLDISANAPALTAGLIELSGTGTLNITGYTPDETENPFDGSANKQTVVATSGGVFNFNPAITVAGQANADFLSASAFVDGNDIVAETRLRWYSTDPNREAHGTFTIADGQIFTLGAALADNSFSTNLETGWDGNSLTKTGGGTLVLGGANTYSGDTTVAAGTLKVTGTLEAGTYSGAIANAGQLVFEQTVDQELRGEISGAGSLQKDGSGILTLSSANSYTGQTTVSAGTLALAAGGSIANSSLLLGSAGTLRIATDTFLAGFEAAKGATLDAGMNTLDLSGTPVVFNLDGAGNGDIILNVSTAGGLKINANPATVTLTNAADNLEKGSVITLATNLTADSNVTTDKWISGRNQFLLSIDGSYSLLASLAGVSSFVEASNDYLGPRAPGNFNIQNGGAYLDWLLTQPFADTAHMEALDKYFAAITDTLPDTAGISELQRFYGAYSAYTNQALAADAARFRRHWQMRNHTFLDNYIFGTLLSETANSITSDAGLASPVYSARQCVPVGQSNVWASGFGSWAKQDALSDLAGYKYDSYGLALGYEYVLDRLKLGVAAAYSRGNLKVDDLGYKNDTDVVNIALHAAYYHESGLYAEGGFGYGHAWNDYRASMLLGGHKNGKYGSDTFSADLELGYIARLPRSVNLVPSIGLEYDYIRNDSWSERVSSTSGLTANRFQSGRDHGLDIPLGLRLSKVFSFGCDGGYIVPEVRTAFVYSANRSRPAIQSGFAGAPGGATMRGVEPGRSHWRIGGGLSGRVNPQLDFHLNYEFETRSGFKGHNLNASVGLSF